MTVRQLAETLGLTVLSMPDGDVPVTGAYIGDLLSWVMGRAQEGQAWVTIMSNINLVAVASLAAVSCVILAEGVTVEDGVRETAEQRNVNLLSCDKTAYDIACLLREQGV